MEKICTGSTPLVPGDRNLSVLPADGFYALDHDGVRAFRWSRPAFTLPAGAVADPYLSLELAAPFPGSTLTLRQDGCAQVQVLTGIWQTVDFALSPDAPAEFFLDQAFRPEDDRRELGVMLAAAMPHDDPRRHAVLDLRARNAALNRAEFAAGAETIASVPPDLRVTVSKICNIANEKPCVYCSWDWAKRLETGSPDQDATFLAGMGRYIDAPTAINDCSYGEPPLEKDFAEILDLTTDYGRYFEFTSNGQTLGPRVRRRLLGRTARVDISIDAATAAGYRRYRDHRFERIVENLRALCADKKAHADLPEVAVSFIVMRSNRAEIADFVALMRDVGVDRVIFRTLYLEDRLAEKRTTHYGYAFDYDAECLTPAELDEIAPVCRAEAAEAGLVVAIEWEDFVAHHAAPDPGRPLCSEPWNTAYLLNRGIMPCCYGRTPLVPWSDVDLSAGIEEGLDAALNAEPYREIRRELAAGRLPEYCRCATGCPIVKKHMGAASGPVPE